MHDYDWVGYLVPVLVLVIGGIGRIAQGIRRAQRAGVLPGGPPPPVAPPAAPPPRPAAVSPPAMGRITPPPPPPAVARLVPMAPLPVARPLPPLLFGDPDHARRAIILAEVLGPPVALRTTSPTRNAF